MVNYKAVSGLLQGCARTRLSSKLEVAELRQAGADDLLEIAVVFLFYIYFATVVGTNSSPLLLFVAC